MGYLRFGLCFAEIFSEYSVFFDEDKLIILLHGFQKKTQKTPKNEITKAKRIREEYYEQKK